MQARILLAMMLALIGLSATGCSPYLRPNWPEAPRWFSSRDEARPPKMVSSTVPQPALSPQRGFNNPFPGFVQGNQPFLPLSGRSQITTLPPPPTLAANSSPAARMTPPTPSNSRPTPPATTIASARQSSPKSNSTPNLFPAPTAGRRPVEGPRPPLPPPAQDTTEPENSDQIVPGELPPLPEDVFTNPDKTAEPNKSANAEPAPMLEPPAVVASTSAFDKPPPIPPPPSLPGAPRATESSTPSNVTDPTPPATPDGGLNSPPMPPDPKPDQKTASRNKKIDPNSELTSEIRPKPSTKPKAKPPAEPKPVETLKPETELPPLAEANPPVDAPPTFVPMNEQPNLANDSPPVFIPNANSPQANFAPAPVPTPIPNPTSPSLVAPAPTNNPVIMPEVGFSNNLPANPTPTPVVVPNPAPAPVPVPAPANPVMRPNLPTIVPGSQPPLSSQPPVSLPLPSNPEPTNTPLEDDGPQLTAPITGPSASRTRSREGLRDSAVATTSMSDSNTNGKVLPSRSTAMMVARVGNEAITFQELNDAVNEWISKNAPGQPISPSDRNLLGSRILMTLVERSLLLQEAHRKIKDPARWQQFRKHYIERWETDELPGWLRQTKAEDPNELKAKLREQGLDIDKIREDYVLTQMSREFIQIRVAPKLKPTLPDLLAYYKAHVNDPGMKQEAEVVWREVAVEVSKCRDREDAEDRANLLLRRLRRGEDFATLASKESHGSTAKEGGRWVTSPAPFANQAINKALQTAPISEVGNIIEGPSSFHIIKVESRRQAGPKSFAEAQDEIRLRIIEERFETEAKAYLKELRQATAVSTIFDTSNSEAGSSPLKTE